jgi:hypothetical protein
MNPTTSSHPTPPPPAGSTPPGRGQHSTRRVVLAAVAGLALGAAGLGLLSSAPVEGSGALPPAAAASETVPADTGPVGSPAAPVDQAVAEQAALTYLGQGRVTWVTPEDDRGAAWEVEVTLPNGHEVDVLVDASGQVIHARQGLARWLP